MDRMNKLLTGGCFMTIRISSALLAAVLMAPGTLVFANEGDVNAAKHPVTAYDQHKVRSSAEQSAIYKQKLDETKAQLDQAKKDLSDARSKNQMNVAEAAEKRVQSLQKKYDQLARKLDDEKKDLGEAK